MQLALSVDGQARDCLNHLVMLLLGSSIVAKDENSSIGRDSEGPTNVRNSFLGAHLVYGVESVDPEGNKAHV